MTTRVRPSILAAILLGGLAACDAKDEPRSDKSTLFRTDSQAYTLRSDRPL